MRQPRMSALEMHGNAPHSCVGQVGTAFLQQAPFLPGQVLSHQLRTCADISDNASRAALRAANISRQTSWLRSRSAVRALFSMVRRSARAAASASAALSCCTRSSRVRRSACSKEVSKHAAQSRRGFKLPPIASSNLRTRLNSFKQRHTAGCFLSKRRNQKQLTAKW